MEFRFTVNITTYFRKVSIRPDAARDRSKTAMAIKRWHDGCLHTNRKRDYGSIRFFRFVNRYLFVFLIPSAQHETYGRLRVTTLLLIVFFNQNSTTGIFWNITSAALSASSAVNNVTVQNFHSGFYRNRFGCIASTKITEITFNQNVTPSARFRWILHRYKVEVRYSKPRGLQIRSERCTCF